MGEVKPIGVPTSTFQTPSDRPLYRLPRPGPLAPYALLLRGSAGSAGD